MGTGSSPLLAGEGEAHYASSSVQKKQLAPPVIEQSALSRLDHLAGTQPKESARTTKGPTPTLPTPMRLPDKSTPKATANQFAYYA